MKRMRGFTLIEVLVAMVLISMIGVLGWKFLQTVDTTRSSLTTFQQEDETWHATWRQWLLDLDYQFDSQPSHFHSDGYKAYWIRQHDNVLSVVAWKVQEGILMRWEKPIDLAKANLRLEPEESQEARAWLAQGTVGAGNVTQWSPVQGLTIQVFVDTWINPTSVSSESRLQGFAAATAKQKAVRFIFDVGNDQKIVWDKAQRGIL